MGVFCRAAVLPFSPMPLFCDCCNVSSGCCIAFCCVCGAFSDLISDLAGKTDRITPEEFLQAARDGISSELIAFARERGVPEEVIAEGRARIVEIMADALRFGVLWPELVNGAAEA